MLWVSSSSHLLSPGLQGGDGGRRGWSAQPGGRQPWQSGQPGQQWDRWECEAVAGTPSTRGWGGGQTSSLSQEDQSRPAGSDQQNPGVQQDQEVSNSGTEQSEKVSNTREHESEEVTKSCSQYWQARLSEKDHEVSKS